jgi:hypothetical protein
MDFGGSCRNNFLIAGDLAAIRRLWPGTVTIQDFTGKFATGT